MPASGFNTYPVSGYLISVMPIYVNTTYPVIPVSVMLVYVHILYVDTTYPVIPVLYLWIIPYQ